MDFLSLWFLGWCDLKNSCANLVACQRAIKMLIHHINKNSINYRLSEKCIIKSLIPNFFGQYKSSYSYLTYDLITKKKEKKKIICVSIHDVESKRVFPYIAVWCLA